MISLHPTHSTNVCRLQRDEVGQRILDKLRANCTSAGIALPPLGGEPPLVSVTDKLPKQQLPQEFFGFCDGTAITADSLHETRGPSVHIPVQHVYTYSVADGNSNNEDHQAARAVVINEPMPASDTLTSQTASVPCRTLSAFVGMDELLSALDAPVDGYTQPEKFPWPGADQSPWFQA